MKKTGRNFLFLLLLILLFSAPSFLVAQTSSEIAFTKVEVAISNKDSDSVFEILSESYGEPYFTELETFVLDQARQLIITNDLDFARDVTLALIDNNLDNFDAVDLYTSIDKAIAKREAARLAVEEKQQLEEMRVQVAAARTRQALQKEYKTITNTVSGETVYLDQDINSHYLPISWNVVLGMANIGLATANTSVSIKYGLLMDANLKYNGERFVAGVDIGADVLMLSFAGNTDMIMHVKAIPEFSFKALNSNLFFRVGFNSNIGNAKITTSMNKFFTPLIGVSYRNMGPSSISNLKFGVYVDYMFGHFFYDDINFAMELGGNATLILADLDSLDIYFHLGLNSGLFSTSNGFQSQTRIVLGIGVGNND